MRHRDARRTHSPLGGNKREENGRPFTNVHPLMITLTVGAAKPSGHLWRSLRLHRALWQQFDISEMHICFKGSQEMKSNSEKQDPIEKDYFF